MPIFLVQQMKHKISELESKGIRPDRSNVQPHLNNIKMFATPGWFGNCQKILSMKQKEAIQILFQEQKLVKDLRELQLNLTTVSFPSLLNM